MVKLGALIATSVLAVTLSATPNEVVGAQIWCARARQKISTASAARRTADTSGTNPIGFRATRPYLQTRRLQYGLFWPWGGRALPIVRGRQVF